MLSTISTDCRALLFRGGARRLARRKPVALCLARIAPSPRFTAPQPWQSPRQAGRALAAMW